MRYVLVLYDIKVLPVYLTGNVYECWNLEEKYVLNNVLTKTYFQNIIIYIQV